MSSGLKPSLHFSILLAIGAALAILLVLLPKTVVVNETGMEQSASISAADSTQTDDDVHASLTAEQEATIKEIKADNSDSNTQFQALSTYFASQNLFDSAAYYAEQVALKSQSAADWTKAGDFYYQAYSLSIQPMTMEKNAEKTRKAYQMVLDKNPRDLHAKTNMAMTYVKSDSPMQAIGMLREVLAENPKYTPAIMSLGALSIQSGQYDKAIARFQEVLSYEPANMNAQLGLAYSLIESGDKEKGKVILEGLLKTDIDDVLKNEINNTLQSIK